MQVIIGQLHNTPLFSTYISHLLRTRSGSRRDGQKGRMYSIHANTQQCRHCVHSQHFHNNSYNHVSLVSRPSAIIACMRGWVLTWFKTVIYMWLVNFVSLKLSNNLYATGTHIISSPFTVVSSPWLRSLNFTYSIWLFYIHRDS